MRSGSDVGSQLKLNGQQRMKVDINNHGDGDQDMGENSYISVLQAQQMQAQLNIMQKAGQETTQEKLAKSREQNKRKVVGVSNIRTLIKSAATRE